MCNCKGGCNKCTPYVVLGKGAKGDPGPAPDISMDITLLPPGSEVSVTRTGVSPVLHYQIGMPEQPVPEFSVVATTLSAGSSATASLDNTDPAHPAMTLGIPRGANGFSGIDVFAPLLDDTMGVPALGGTTVLTVGNNSWATPGRWVHIRSAGYFIVDAVISDDVISIRNPTALQMQVYWPGWTGTANPLISIPGNSPAGSIIPSDGTPTQVAVCGVPGVRGAAGAPGTPVTPTGPILAEPNLPPVVEAERMVLATDSLSSPTWQRIFIWDGAAWNGGPNILGRRGSTAYFGTTDPNTAPVPGAVAGDTYSRAGVNTRQSFQFNGTSWVLQDTLALLGTSTTEVVMVGPGTYSVNASSFSHKVSTDKNIELDWSDTSYDGQGEWAVAIKNTDGGSPINLTYSAGKWERLPTLTLPTTIAPGVVVLVRFMRNMHSGLMTITSAFTPTAV